MMWSDGDRSLAGGWWWLGVLFMGTFMIICMVMMARMMMGHGTHGSHTAESHGQRDEMPERTLDNRLARGEIDIDEYERLLAALQRTGEHNPR